MSTSLQPAGWTAARDMKGEIKSHSDLRTDLDVSVL